MLGNSIALITLAVMLASEAKRSEPPWRYGLLTLATIVALGGVALGPITDEAPAIGVFLTAIFGMPISWFILLISLFFVLRPFWQPRSADGSAPMDHGGGATAVEGAAPLDKSAVLDLIAASIPPPLPSVDPAKVEAAERRITDMGKALDKLTKLTHVIADHIITERRKVVFDIIESAIERVDSNLDVHFHGSGSYPDYSNIEQMLLAVGADQKDFRDALNHVYQEIKNSNEYAYVREGEPWATPDDKKAWHMRHSKPSAYKRVLEHRKKKTLRHSELSLLQSTRDLRSPDSGEMG